MSIITNNAIPLYLLEFEEYIVNETLKKLEHYFKQQLSFSRNEKIWCDPNDIEELNYNRGLINAYSDALDIVRREMRSE